jgi:addiction module RelE/StbE family toxin
MKAIRRTTQFKRHYKTRVAKDERLRQAYWDSVEGLLTDPTSVADHPLKNVMQGYRSFSINDDYRVVYIEYADYYLFTDIGTHDQVYHVSMRS